jgi:hypothetical protein
LFEALVFDVGAHVLLIRDERERARGRLLQRLHYDLGNDMLEGCASEEMRIVNDVVGHVCKDTVTWRSNFVLINDKFAKKSIKEATLHNAN